MLLSMRSKEGEAEEAFRTAISLAPTYADPFAHLAAVRAKHGYLRDAVRLIEKAAQFAPQSAQFAQRLEAYRALAEIQSEPGAQMIPAENPAQVSAENVPASVREEMMRPVVAALDWRDLSKRLTSEGYVRIPALVDPTTCATLRCNVR